MALLMRNVCKVLSKTTQNGAVRSFSASKVHHQESLVEQEGKTKCTLIPGDGVGPELVLSVQQVFKAANVPVEFEPYFLSEVNPTLSAPLEQVSNSIARNRVCLKGILATPDHSHTGELQTLNMKLRNKLDLYSNVVHVKSLPGVNSRHKNVDCVIIREQSEGEYSALEHECVKGVVECLKIVTATKSQRIAKFAFDYAVKNNRKKVTCVHKANIMKLGDGLFLKSCQEIAKLYPKHTYSEAVGKNVANPTALILCSVKLLNHINLKRYAVQIREALNRVLNEGKVRTKDLGGQNSTTDFTQAVISALHHLLAVIRQEIVKNHLLVTAIIQTEINVKKKAELMQEVEKRKSQLVFALAAFKKANIVGACVIDKMAKDELMSTSEEQQRMLRKRRDKRGLADTANKVNGTKDELEQQQQAIILSGKLLGKYGRREVTDKALLTLAFIFFLACVAYVLQKRLW
ncbi:Similar to IDH3B: Isocitrate dehydrogenase [NAD] subunit beta [Cotesia congregata]|uniref:Mitochondrial (Bos taurus) n=1 Tax=Cotesia congregata TaxID=51543 RepID=A0A8J2EDU9_COTCN|nr:Similar to IDH3B: Isocitrate dehydrogenase [NAD] subunit beta [Cotesia congregata]